MRKSEFPGLKRFKRKDGTERLIWSCSNQARVAGFGYLTANLTKYGSDPAALSNACIRYDRMQKKFLATNYSDNEDHLERHEIERDVHHWIMFSGNRAKHRGVEITIDKEHLIQLLAAQNWRCALSKIPFKMSQSLRVDLDLMRQRAETAEACAEEYEKALEEIVREVAELPDRTSPEDAPDMMLVSANELRAIVLAALNPKE